ncbi:MAG: hypothetical protein HYR51_05665 [Candidatus Rokubacteria bacterium]|nr:hypothetical protein [Candidatus Rokubacteria bacterium]
MSRRPYTTAVVILGAALALTLAAYDRTGAAEYHVGPTLYCDECHAMRAAGGAVSRPLLPASPVNAVCLGCHDGQRGIPDVLGDDVNSVSGPRQAGALATGSWPYEHWKGHTLDATDTAPGAGAAPRANGPLTCTQCHAPHGNASYRNLATPITYQVSTARSNTADVRIDLPAVPPVGQRVAAGYYASTKTFFNRPSAVGSAYGAFCASCHAAFHGAAQTGAASPFVRHPTDGVGLRFAHATQYNSRPNKVAVAFPDNGAGAAYGMSASTSCMSCHKAHGNRNPFALIFMRPTGLPSEQGVDGGTVQDLCGQCHPTAMTSR